MVVEVYPTLGLNFVEWVGLRRGQFVNWQRKERCTDFQIKMTKFIS